SSGIASKASTSAIWTSESWIACADGTDVEMASVVDMGADCSEHAPSALFWVASRAYAGRRAMTNRPATYWDYIRVEDLLALQGGLERDEKDLSNDEVLFITLHQVFELWFKLILRELKAARDLF